MFRNDAGQRVGFEPVGHVKILCVEFGEEVVNSVYPAEVVVSLFHDSYMFSEPPMITF
jgi:hypothetical protein